MSEIKKKFCCASSGISINKYEQTTAMCEETVKWLDAESFPSTGTS